MEIIWYRLYVKPKVVQMELIYKTEIESQM